jgi:hypothetical protein
VAKEIYVLENGHVRATVSTVQQAVEEEDTDSVVDVVAPYAKAAEAVAEAAVHQSSEVSGIQRLLWNAPMWFVRVWLAPESMAVCEARGSRRCLRQL